MKKITINGRTFQLINPRTKIEPNYGYVQGENAIFNYYDRPSQAKIEIWSDWVRWAFDTDGIEVFEISGANSMQFSIRGLYMNPETGDTYNLYITRDNNKAYQVY